jgi:hypothetical protein
MTTYNVHVYRQMRLRFDGIEAETPEAAASVAHKKLTRDADYIEDCEGEDSAALVDMADDIDQEYEHSRVIDFEPERQRRAAPDLLAALTWLVDDLTDAEEDRNPETGEEYDSVSFARTAIAQAKATGISPAEPSEPPTATPYSVLLLYPDYANDGGTETYYAFVSAADSFEAVALAQQQAATAQVGVDIESDDFVPLLVTQGHHFGEALFNK